jgi:NAD(P)-binding Rossmann-like domain
MKILILLYASVGLVASQANRKETVSPEFEPSSYAERDVLYRDVAVIGGGSTGTYGAIKLLDMGRSVAVVERAAVFGGHENTYIVPETGFPIDFGVQSYWNISVVRDFFARFDIPITNYTFVLPSTVYADMRTGVPLRGFSPPRNYSSYTTELNKYPALSYSWNLPDPIPRDLLIPFGEFITKYSLQNIAYSLYLYSAGIGNILTQVTVNFFKWLDYAYLDGVGGNNIWTARRNNGELYVRAVAELGQSALLSSTVIAAHRSRYGKGVRLVVRTPTGNKLIVASQMLISIPPILENMGPFGLDRRETDLFDKFTYTAYYNGLVNNTGLANNTRYINAGANTTYNIPDLPAVYSISPTRAEGVYLYWYGSPTPMSQEEVDTATAATIRRLTNVTTQSMDFIAFSSHTPFKLVVSAEEISDRFYDRWNAMQGYRNTWYTGAAINSHGSGPLWNFTQELLPQIDAAV